MIVGDEGCWVCDSPYDHSLLIYVQLSEVGIKSALVLSRSQMKFKFKFKICQMIKILVIV